jgi:hypothetical protein
LKFEQVTKVINKFSKTKHLFTTSLLFSAKLNLPVALDSWLKGELANMSEFFAIRFRRFCRFSSHANDEIVENSETGFSQMAELAKLNPVTLPPVPPFPPIHPYAAYLETGN